MNKRIIALLLTLSVLLSSIFVAGAFLVAADNNSDEPLPLYTGVFAGGGFENEDDLSLWTVRSKKDQTISIDTETTHNNSDGALAIDMPTDYYGKTTILNFRGKTAAGAAANFNTYADYYAEMYIKTSEDFCGSVYMRLYQNGAYVQSNGALDLLLLGSKTAGGSAVPEWQKIKTSGFAVDNTDIQVLLYVNGTGKIWIDDITLTEDKNILPNGGFDSGLSPWMNWGGVGNGRAWEITNTETCASSGALKFTVDEKQGGMIYMVNDFFAKLDVTKQYTLSIDVKCEGVAVGDAFVRVYQYYDVEGVQNRKFLKCYGSDNALATGGTTDWQHFEVKLSGFEPTLQAVKLMVYLQNGGTVYYDNITICEREKVSAAAGQIVADPEAGVVEPMTSVMLVSSDDSSDIYYTIDGSDPAKSSTARLFDETRGIYVTEDVKIKACTISEETVGKVFEFDYTCPVGIIEEDKLLKEVVHQSNITLDTVNKKVGSNSIKIQGTGGTRYTSTGDMSLDSAFDYRLEFWAKTEDLMDAENAFVNVFMAGHGSRQNIIDGRWGAYVDTANIIEGIKETQDWTHYEVIINELDEFWPTLNFSAGLFNESGTLWIDGVKLTALPKDHYPLTVSSDGKVYGNNYYYENLFGNFELEQSFLINNKANNLETGTMTYSVYKDLDLENAIGGGDFNVSVFGNGVGTGSVNLTMCASYGTYTIKFAMKNSRGYEYDAGSIKVAVIKDASKINSDTIFGVNGAALPQFGMYESTGVGMVRSDLHWADFEKVEGQFEVTETHENLANYCLEYGMDQLFIINTGSSPSWYDPEGGNNFPKSDKQIAQFISFTKKVVSHFKGRVKYYECFNEADWISNVKVDAKTYAKVLKEFYKAVKEVDPDAYVVAGATSLFHHSWAKEVIEIAGNYMDYWSLHPYANPTSVEDSYGGNWLGDMETLQGYFKTYTGKEMPMIIDEWGWSENRASNGANKYTAAPWYVRYMAFAESLGYVERLVVYRDFDGGTGNNYVQEQNYGLYELHTSTTAYARPHVPAITNYLNMTNGYNFSEKLDLAKGLYAFKYTSKNNDKDVYLLWTNDVKYTANITTANTSGRLYDLYGNVMPVGYDGNMLSTDIDGKVIYLTLDEKDKIESIVLLDESGKDVSKEDEKDEQSTNNDNANSGENASTEDTTKEEGPKKQLVRRKKIVKKVIKKGNSEGFNYLPLIIGGAAVLVAAAVGGFLIIIFKKRKKSKA